MDTSCYQTKEGILKFREYDASGKATGITLKDILEQNNKKSFSTKISDYRLPVQSRGEQALIVGRYTLKLTDGILKSDQGRWTLTGEIKAFDDTFNYDKSNRSWLPETATSVARNIQKQLRGKDYTLQIRGSKHITIKGSWQE